jgi:hypothetical protein
MLGHLLCFFRNNVPVSNHSVRYLKYSVMLGNVSSSVVNSCITYLIISRFDRLKLSFVIQIVVEYR